MMMKTLNPSEYWWKNYLQWRKTCGEKTFNGREILL